MFARFLSFLLLFLFILINPPFANTTSQKTAFVDVHVIPMDSERVLQNQTVIVENGNIRQIGAVGKTSVPEDAVLINGEGKLYLMPGLADMHVHIHSNTDALLWLANGVTTVRNMRGTSLHLAWKDQIRSGKLQIFPALYSAGPILDGLPPTGENVTVVETESEIETSVAAHKKAGFDFIKVYNRLSPRAYAALIQSAQKYDLPVAGHVPSNVGVRGALLAKQASIEHLTGYMSALKTAEGKINNDQIEKLARMTREAKVWNCVTLVVQHKLSDAENFEALLKRPETQYVPPLRRAIWAPSRDARFQAMDHDDFEAAKRGLSVLSKLTGALQRAGAGILLGTDAPSRMVVPGFSAHEELQYLVQAGLTPYEALAAATRNAAIFSGAEKEFGTVESGKRADLILLKTNPLKDIRNSKQIAGVMVRGLWLPETRIQQILNDIKESYDRKRNRFEGMPPLPSESSVKSGRFEIMTRGVVVGEERFALLRNEDGSTVLKVQQETDAPFDSRYEMTVTSAAENQTIEILSERPEGKGNLQIHLVGNRLKWNGEIPYQSELSSGFQQFSEETLLNTGMISFKLLLRDRLRIMKEGDAINIRTKELDMGIFANQFFEWKEETWKIVRRPDRDNLRIFTIKISAGYHTKEAVLTTDAECIPVSFEQSSRSFRRMAPK